MDDIFKIGLTVVHSDIYEYIVSVKSKPENRSLVEVKNNSHLVVLVDLGYLRNKVSQKCMIFFFA